MPTVTKSDKVAAYSEPQVGGQSKIDELTELDTWFRGTEISIRVPVALACERQTFLLAHRRWGTFHEERGETSAVRRLPLLRGA